MSSSLTSAFAVTKAAAPFHHNKNGERKYTHSFVSFHVSHYPAFRICTENGWTQRRFGGWMDAEKIQRHCRKLVMLSKVHCKTLHIPSSVSGFNNRLLMLSKSFHFRRFSQAVATAILHPDAESLHTYLEGFPTLDPKYAHTIVATPRPSSGSNISAKERKGGRVPSIFCTIDISSYGRTMEHSAKVDGQNLLRDLLFVFTSTGCLSNCTCNIHKTLQEYFI